MQRYNETIVLCESWVLCSLHLLTLFGRKHLKQNGLYVIDRTVHINGLQFWVKLLLYYLDYNEIGFNRAV